MLYTRAMFKIYYTDPVSDASHSHNVLTLTDALQYTEGWRRMGMTFVTMVSENPDSVGRPGVDSVVDGKTMLSGKRWGQWGWCARWCRLGPDGGNFSGMTNSG